MIIPQRRLPGGARTPFTDEYINTWIEFATPVAKRLGWTLAAFDPHFTFTDGRGESVQLTVGQVEDLAAALEAAQ